MLSFFIGTGVGRFLILAVTESPGLSYRVLRDRTFIWACTHSLACAHDPKPVATTTNTCLSLLELLEQITTEWVA